MRNILQQITDRVATKKGMWITLITWVLVMVILTVAVPNIREYKVTSIDSLPSDMQSNIANKKIEEYFGDCEFGTN